MNVEMLFSQKYLEGVQHALFFCIRILTSLKNLGQIQEIDKNLLTEKLIQIHICSKVNVFVWHLRKCLIMIQ